MAIPFIKAHCAGNDFVMLDKQQIPHLDDDLILNITDRNLGIGCDQLIIYECDGNTAQMEIYNRDGSRATMCGNATICLCYLLCHRYHRQEIQIKVAGRILNGVIEGDRCIVNMGNASFAAPWMPAYEQLTALAFANSLRCEYIACADVGNRHLVIVNPGISTAEYHLVGQALSTASLFLDGINVNFVTIGADSLELRVWERGAGLTLACGSGACASFALSKKLGLIGESTQVNFSKGNLLLRGDGDNIMMGGKASIVANGQYYYV